MNSNSRRVLDSVVSLDAWHSKFDHGNKIASVHVDVSFNKGKLGEEQDSPIRFQLALKRAEIVFVIPASEPIAVIQPSVKREPPLSVQTTVTDTKSTNRSLGGTVQFGLAKTGSKGGIDASARAASEQGAKQEKQYTKIESGIRWSQSLTSDGRYKWEMTPNEGRHLFGKVWDAVAEPILKVKSLASKPSLIEDAFRIEIYCRREDLIISNIEFKQNSLIDSIRSSISDRKKAAVEAFIRNALSSQNLDIANFDDPFGQIQLADIIIGKLIE